MEMSRFLRTFGLPLLTRELIEQAARRRTYIIRVLYAVLLYAAAYLCFYSLVQIASASRLGILGRGRDMYLALVYLQFAGIYLFMPAMTCGAITQEKEQLSLQLLFLTRLGPWTIVIEKLLSRLIPMLGFILLSLPLLAFAYSMGGVSQGLLWTGVWLLVLAAIQMGTLALACSAFLRTTVGSFMASYTIAFTMLFGPYFTWMMLWLAAALLGIDIDRLFAGQTANIPPALMILLAFPFFGPAIAIYAGSFPGGVGPWPLMAHSAIILSVSAVCLGLARHFLVRRAFLPPRNLLLEMLRSLDRRPVPAGADSIAPANPADVASESSPSTRPADTAAAIAVAHDETSLPVSEPIAWRETTKRSLGRSRYFIRVLMVLEIPLLLLCAVLVNGGALPGYAADTIIRVAFAMMVFLLWALAALVVSVRSASLIPGERSHQTLDVLCTTPLTGREIVIQKFRGVRQLIVLFTVPFLTIIPFETWWMATHGGGGAPRGFDPVLQIVCSVLSVVIYLPLVAWLSLAIGLKVRSQARAMIGSVGAVVGWCVLPVIFIGIPLMIMTNGSGGEDLRGYVFLLSPATIVFMNESNALGELAGGPLMPIIVNFAIYGVIVLRLRAMCLTHADRMLGRLEPRELPHGYTAPQPGSAQAAG